MKFKAVIAAGVAVLTLAIGFGAQTPTASAAPPDQDHEYSVNLSTTVPGGNPTIVQELALCTDQDGDPENAASGQQCPASSPASPFFDQATAEYKGIINAGAPLAARIALVTFDIETNAGAIQAIGTDAGQPAECGSVAHIAPPAFEVWSGLKTGATVSMDPSLDPGFSVDQQDDPAQGGVVGTDAIQGNGWPKGIGAVPVVVPTVQTLAGIPNAAIIARGYGVAIVQANVSQTTVTFLTIATGGAPGTANSIKSVTILGNPFGQANPGAADTTTCPPFFSSVTQHGASLASNGSKSIQGTTLGPAGTDYSPAHAGGSPVLTICSAGCTAGYAYNILLSSTDDDDQDGVNNAADSCPTVPNAGGPSFAGVGAACDGVGDTLVGGQGYDNSDAAVLSRFATCLSGGNPTATVTGQSCTDVDGDNFLNAVDNCPFKANGITGLGGTLIGTNNQLNFDGDGRGDVCEGDGTDASSLGTNVEGAVDGYFSPQTPIDGDDICQALFPLNGANVNATVECLQHGALDAHPSTGGPFPFKDSNDDGIPDFLVTTLDPRDHKADSNGDGYSDADQGTPANCGTTSCNSVISYGTGETNSCASPGRNCGSGVTIEPEAQPRTSANGTGTGCWKGVDTVGSNKTTNLAKSDVDLDGSVSILDLSKVASWFGNPVGPGDDPRNEGNMDTDTNISILDLSAMAANFGRNVAATCTVINP